MSAPKMTVRSIHTATTIEVELDGVEPRPKPYSRSGATYLPHLAVLKYSSGDFRSETVELVGHVLRKSGEPSSNRARETFYRTDKLPDWLETLLVANRPGCAA